MCRLCTTCYVDLTDTGKRRWSSISYVIQKDDRMDFQVERRETVDWKLLPILTTFTTNLYCKQLTTVTEKIKGNIKRVDFLYDNARRHVAKMTRQKIQELL
uniref:Histone-lysine N-methyltransferase SETMAR n=1 Tax=Caenorhabditis japonica TaxID=281687 RepID=A0A8R1ET14_CAEJA